MTLQRSGALNSIPERKLLDALEDTLRACVICSSNGAKLGSGLCELCRINNVRIKRYADSNIPVLYWNLEMERDFVGYAPLKEKYLSVTKDLRASYKEGIAFCLAGSFGCGKSFLVTNILKRAAEKNFSALYTNLSDVISILLSSDDKHAARRELLLVDFLAIDEFDPRYMIGEKSAELFGKILEEIFRTRSQNKLPIMMCTNSPNVVASFSGGLKQSINSLMSTVEIIPVLGGDQRIALSEAKKTAKKIAKKQEPAVAK